MEVAEQYGARPILRPSSLATDDSPSEAAGFMQLTISLAFAIG